MILMCAIGGTIDIKGARSAPGLETPLIDTNQQIQSVLYCLRIFTVGFTEVYEEMKHVASPRPYRHYSDLPILRYLCPVAVLAKNRPLV